MPQLTPIAEAALRSQHPNTALLQWYLAVAPYATSPHPNDNPCFQAFINQAGWANQRNVWDVDFNLGVFNDSYDVEQGALTWNPVANSFQDAAQDFSDWQALIGEALYVIVVVNNAGNTSWAFLGADFDTGVANDSIYVYKESTLATAGWNGTAPAGNAVSYNIYIAPNAGMTLWVDAAAHNAYGEGRVRIKSVEGDDVDGISGTIHVAENSEIEWTDTSFLTIPGACGFRELWAKYPLLTSTDHFMDYDVNYTNEGDHLPPKANAGPPVCAWIDPTSGLATVDFVGSYSYVTEIDPGTGVAYLWDATTPCFWSFPGGTPATSLAWGTFAVPLTVTWNTPGFRYVSLTVQDEQNVISRIYVPVWIFDEDDEPPYTKVQVNEQRGDVGSGWSAGLKVFQTNTTAEDVIYRFPDGAMVVLFSRTWYGRETEPGTGDGVSIGNWYGTVDGSDEMADLAYVGLGLQDQAPQDFSVYQVAPPGNALFLIRVENLDGTVSWGYCGDAFNTGVPNDSIHVYQDIGLTTAGWNGADPSVGPRTPETYRIHPTDADAGDNNGGDVARSNVRFVGWLTGESLSFNADVGIVGFSALSHDGILRLIPGWPFTLEDIDDNPSEWHEMVDGNVDRMMHHLLEYYTTVNMICHVEKVGEGNTRPVKIQSFPDSSIYNQLQEDLLEDACCLFLSDRQGILRATQDPQMLVYANRVPLMGQVVCTLSSPNANLQGDWMNDIDEDKPHRPSVGMVRIDGIAWDTPLLARAPGLAPVQSSEVTRIGNRILFDQTEANWWAGLAMTKLNNPYPAIPIELTGYWPVFDPAFQEYIRLVTTDPLTRNPMVAPWGEYFLVREVTFEDNADDATALVNLILERENDILIGEKQDVPPAPTPRPMPSPSPLPAPPPWGGDLTHCIIVTTQGVYATETLDEDDPVWFAVNGGLSAINYQDITDATFDYADGSRMFITTSDVATGGAFRCNNVWDREDWTLQFTGAQAVAAITALGALGDTCVDADAAFPTYDGQVSCINCDPVTGYLEMIAGAHTGTLTGCNSHKRAFCSTDSLETPALVGDDVNHDADCGDKNHSDTRWAGQISIAGGNALYNYVCGWSDNSDDHRGLCTDCATTVLTCGFPGGATGGQVKPASANPIYHARAGATVYYFIQSNDELYYSTDHGGEWATWANVLPHVIPNTAWNSKQVLCVHNLNPENMMYCGDAAGVWYSADGGVAASWFITPGTLEDSNCVVPAMVSGSTEGECFLVGCDDAPTLWMHLTLDFGVSWLNKTGNLDTWLGVGDTVYLIIPVQSGAM